MSVLPITPGLSDTWRIDSVTYPVGAFVPLFISAPSKWELYPNGTGYYEHDFTWSDSSQRYIESGPIEWWQAKGDSMRIYIGCSLFSASLNDTSTFFRVLDEPNRQSWHLPRTGQTVHLGRN